MAYRLAPLYDLVLGVDLSFTTVLTARRIVLHAPVALDRYRVQLEEGIWSAPLPLQIQVQSNVDFLVASVSSLPFASGMAACATAMNVVDTLPDPRALFREVSRALAADGAFVLSSPYAWAGSLASAARKEGGGTSEGFVDQALRDHALVPERSEPALPWLLRYHSRYWNLYLCHCVESVRESR
jgi:SAM-dependent methyltransferase